MKSVVMLAAGLALFATGALGQESSRDRDDFRRDGWRESRDGWDRDRDRRRGPIMREEDEDDRSERHERGARFYLRSGDAQLRVVCGNRESTQSCVDAALRMFDRMQSSQNTTRAPSTSAPAQPPQ